MISISIIIIDVIVIIIIFIFIIIIIIIIIYHYRYRFVIVIVTIIIIIIFIITNIIIIIIIIVIIISYYLKWSIVLIETFSFRKTWQRGCIFLLAKQPHHLTLCRFIVLLSNVHGYNTPATEDDVSSITALLFKELA